MPSIAVGFKPMILSFNSQLHYQLGYKPLALMTVDCRQLHLCRLHTCVNE